MAKLQESNRALSGLVTTNGQPVGGGLSQQQFPLIFTRPGGGGIISPAARPNGIFRIRAHPINFATAATTVQWQSAFLQVQLATATTVFVPARRFPIGGLNATPNISNLVADLLAPVELRVENFCQFSGVPLQNGLFWQVTALAEVNNSGAGTTANLTAGPAEYEDLLYDTYVWPS